MTEVSSGDITSVSGWLYGLMAVWAMIGFAVGVCWHAKHAAKRAQAEYEDFLNNPRKGAKK